MSFFDFDSADIAACGKYEAALLGYGDNQPVFCDVIPHDYDFSSDLLEEPEHSMNLEEMIEGAYSTQLDYQQQHHRQMDGRGELSGCNSPDADREDLCSTLPRTLVNGEYMMANSPYGADVTSSPAGRSTSSSTKSKSGGKMLSKDSEEYKRRRTLNNIAVKKSREKAKAESRMTAQRLNVLTADKERLERRVDQLNKEIQFLHGLFTKFNDIPEPVKNEVSKAFARLQNHR